MINPDELAHDERNAPSDEKRPTPSGPDEAMAHGVSVAVSRLMLLAALEQQPDFASKSMRPSVISIIEVPHPEWGKDIALAWRLMTQTIIYEESREDEEGAGTSVRAARKRPGRAKMPRSVYGPLELIAVDAATGLIMRERTTRLHQAVREGLPLHAIAATPDTFLPSDLVLTADQRLVIRRPTSEMVIEVAAHIGGGPAAQLTSLDERLTGLIRPSDLLFARRVGQTTDDYLGRIQKLVQARKPANQGGLETLPGMGRATEVGLRIATDLRDFAEGRLKASELDRGLVLEGPPGCGKTTFAKALAASADVPFVAASLQDWQGAKEGHLGTLLAAMRATFDEARALAPCVLLVDELDSLGDRMTFDARHRDYSRQVVNAFLEQLDGANPRAGVFVIGCTNNASGLDPAILRPGRLEQVIQVPLPDPEALLKIFRRYLGDALPGLDLAPLVTVAHQRRATGADVERWCRVARQSARVARRQMVPQDLLDEVGQPPEEFSPTARWRAAVHEAGHVIACLTCGPNVLQSVKLSRHTNEECATAYDLQHLIDDRSFLSRYDARRHLRVMLAGRAAEIEILGDASSGSGGTEQSDLASATVFAARAVTAWGMDAIDQPIRWRPLRDVRETVAMLEREPTIEQRVSLMLGDGLADANKVIREFRELVWAVADALLEGEQLAPGDIERKLRATPQLQRKLALLKTMQCER